MSELRSGVDESLELAFRRGEWATQAEVTRRHSSRGGSKSLVTYAVIHEPSNRVLDRYFSQPEARQLVRWLVRDVPHINEDGEGPREALHDAEAES